MEFTVPVMVYTYWLIAVGIGLAFFRKDIFSFNTDFAKRRIILLVASLLIVALNLGSTQTQPTAAAAHWTS